MAKPLSYTYFDLPAAIKVVRWTTTGLLAVLLGMITFYGCTADEAPLPPKEHRLESPIDR